MKIRIYSGLSVSRADVRRELPGASFRPPARKGDIRRDIRDGVHVIGLVDGVFYQELPVTPGELLDALRVGIKVFGASSMGALRAAELAPFGIVGVGSIFEHIRKQPAFEDDFLGQVAFRAGGAGSSEAFIDTLLALRHARDKGEITSEAYRHAVRIGSRTHFSEWDADRFRRELRDDSRYGARALRLLSEFGGAKRADALALLRVIRRYRDEVRRFYHRGVPGAGAGAFTDR